MELVNYHIVDHSAFIIWHVIVLCFGNEFGNIITANELQ